MFGAAKRTPTTARSGAGDSVRGAYQDQQGSALHGTVAAEVLLIPIELDLSLAQAAMLTLEPEGGAQGTPGPDVVFGELPSS